MAELKLADLDVILASDLALIAAFVVFLLALCIHPGRDKNTSSTASSSVGAVETGNSGFRLMATDLLSKKSREHFLVAADSESKQKEFWPLTLLIVTYAYVYFIIACRSIPLLQLIPGWLVEVCDKNSSKCTESTDSTDSCLPALQVQTRGFLTWIASLMIITLSRSLITKLRDFSDQVAAFVEEGATLESIRDWNYFTIYIIIDYYAETNPDEREEFLLRFSRNRLFYVFFLCVLLLLQVVLLPLTLIVWCLRKLRQGLIAACFALCAVTFGKSVEVLEETENEELASPRTVDIETAQIDKGKRRKSSVFSSFVADLNRADATGKTSQKSCLSTFLSCLGSIYALYCRGKPEWKRSLEDDSEAFVRDEASLWIADTGVILLVRDFDATGKYVKVSIRTFPFSAFKTAVGRTSCFHDRGNYTMVGDQYSSRGVVNSVGGLIAKCLTYSNVSENSMVTVIEELFFERLDSKYEDSVRELREYHDTEDYAFDVKMSVTSDSEAFLLGSRVAVRAGQMQNSKITGSIETLSNNEADAIDMRKYLAHDSNESLVYTFT